MFAEKFSSERDFTFCGDLAIGINNSHNALGALLSTPLLVCLVLPVLACILTGFLKYVYLAGVWKICFFISRIIFTAVTSRGEVPTLLGNTAIQNSKEWSLSEEYVILFLLAF